jgi:predicted RNase H-like HicB family nuclease
VYQRDGDWWIGWVKGLPGANTQGRTLEEARKNLKEAVAMVLATKHGLTHKTDGVEGN